MMNTLFAGHDAYSNTYPLVSKYRALFKNLIIYVCLEFFKYHTGYHHFLLGISLCNFHARGTGWQAAFRTQTQPSSHLLPRSSVLLCGTEISPTEAFQNVTFP